MENGKPNFNNFNPEKVYAALVAILEIKYDCKIKYTIERKEKTQ